MKALVLILISFATLVLSPLLIADTTTTPAKSIQVFAYDVDGNTQITADEVLSGKDKFIARLASSTDVDQHVPGLFVGEDGSQYFPVTVQDLQKLDVDKNNVITAADADSSGIKLVAHQGKQFVLSSLSDNGFSMIRLENYKNAMTINLVPTMGQALIKTHIVTIDKL